MELSVGISLPPPPSLFLSPSSCAGIFKLLRGRRSDSKELIPPAYVASARICKRLRSPGIDSKESIAPCWNWFLGSLKPFKNSGRYDNPIPTRFLAPLDCLKIPALSKLYNPHSRTCILFFFEGFLMSWLLTWNTQMEGVPFRSPHR